MTTTAHSPQPVGKPQSEGQSLGQTSTNGHYKCKLLPGPANWVPGPKQGEWTYEAYAALPEDGQRYEVIEGVLYLMPSPRRKHQRAVLEIAAYLRDFVQVPELGEIYIAPFDVELSPNNVFQPDVLVILNEHLERATETHVVGAPDLVVEVLSPSTKSHDRGPKQVVYARAGVSEYWIVDTKQETIEVLVRENAGYRQLGTFSGPATVKSLVLPDFSIKAEQFFPRKKEPTPVEQDTPQELPIPETTEPNIAIAQDETNVIDIALAAQKEGPALARP